MAKKAKKAAKKAFTPGGFSAKVHGKFVRDDAWLKRTLKPKTRSRGPVLRLEFATPRHGITPEEFGRLFADLWILDQELALPTPSAQEAKGPKPGIYVTSVSFNSPLQVDITLFKLPKGAVEAIVKFFSDILFYKQAAKMRDAEAAERMERVKAMRHANVLAAVLVARAMNDVTEEVRPSVAEVLRAGDDLLDLPLELEQVRPPRQVSGARRTQAKSPRRRRGRKA